MSAKQQTVFYFLVALWFLSLAVFFTWWFQEPHIIGWIRFLINTILLFWTFLLPGYFFFFVSRMKKIKEEIVIPKSWRVAMVATRAPSEPFNVVKKTLLAMLSQKFPHDTWLADEKPTEEIKIWCAVHGINLISREGVKEYHNNCWPRRTKCKEGNLAYFYDKVGYENYDFVAQLDADHVPDPHYLEAVLKPFVNPKIGYVSAPSICDTNAPQSWSARGRLFAESILHGPLQAGHNKTYAPLCIGSHYTIRTKALQEIGGLGPELAEDHSTTLMMNSAGWEGLHNIDAIAHGEGPATFEHCIIQEFQWSRSLMVLLLGETKKHWSNLTIPKRIQFLFAQLWYPLFSLVMLLGFLLPIIAVVTKQPFVSVSFTDFIIHALPINFSILAVVYFLKKNNWLRPYYSPVISWEAVLFAIIRWPWSLIGCTMGVVSFFNKKNVVFKVTPKGTNQNNPLNWYVLIPYIVIIIASFIPTLLQINAKEASGYYFFLILNAIIYIIALLGIISLHTYESKKEGGW